jgi:hypothetical protein
MQSQPEAWRTAYQHDGFVVVPALFGPRTLWQLREGLDQITRHAAPHNHSEPPRRTLLSVWAGPDVLPTSAERSAYHGVRPRSQQPAYAHQMRLTFPHLFPGQG